MPALLSFDKDAFTGYCSEHSSKDMKIIIEQIMLILRTCFETHPMLSYPYPLFYAVMRFCYLQIDQPSDSNLHQTAGIAEILSEEVESLNNLYAQARDYLDAVIIKPAENSIQLPGSVVAELYHSYCLCANKQDFQSDALSSMKLKPAFLSERSSASPLSDSHSGTRNWLEYLNNASVFVTDNTITKYLITSFKQFLYISIRQMLEDELVIKNVSYATDFFV